MGDLIERRSEHAGDADYLHGQRIRHGDRLLQWQVGQWIQVRYEIVEPDQLAVVLARAGSSVPLDRSTMRFKWA